MSFLIITSLIILSIAISIIHVPQMISNKLYKELILFSVLLICGLAIAILKSLNVDISTPSDWVKAMYSPLTDRFGDIYK
jgi:hypothetical protein